MGLALGGIWEKMEGPTQVLDDEFKTTKLKGEEEQERI